MFSAAEREPACRWRNYVKIEECNHTTPTEGDDKTEAKSYTIDSNQHTMHCRYCAYTRQENHTFVDDVCNTCGKQDNTSDNMWSVTLHRASAAGSYGYADRVVVSISKVSGKEDAVFGWFTLDGRRLSSKPTAKGIYINNGHKVVIK